MGAFYTNIQLKKTCEGKTVDIDSIINFITQIHSEEGYFRVDKEEDADKSIIIQQTNNSNWISIYDEELEIQNTKKLNKIASNLSKQFETTALSLLVHDSDLMYLGLSKNGKLKDSLSNLSKEIDFKKNKPSEWLNILSDKKTFEDIKLGWSKKNLFVEEFLFEFSNLAGIEYSKLTIGYDYLCEVESIEGIRLNFAKKGKIIKPLGETKIALMGTEIMNQVRIGEKFICNIFLTNYGDVSKGLDIIIAGEAIENGIIIPNKAIVNYFPILDETQGEFNENFTETISTTGQKIYYIRLENFNFKKGYEPNYPMSNKEYKQYNKKRIESAFKCHIEFMVVKGGNEQILFYFSPLANRKLGSCCYNFVID